MKGINNLMAIYFLPPCYFSCKYSKNQSNGTVSIKQDAEKDHDLINQYVEAIQKGDFQLAAMLLHPNFMAHGPEVGKSRNKRQEMSYWRALHLHCKDVELKKPGLVSLKVNEGFCKGDWMLGWGNYKITNCKEKNTLSGCYHMAAKTDGYRIIEIQFWYEHNHSSI
ncbi:hypothetical protein [Pleomorphovibrio marinus]|uniref:hypothetical protein n=1 Tax=Pleomorphovibrio marinus TaxID=2164132 RepID=UPI000E0BF70B|nr:hypothetical protein [Pleomorphovibrio marinus]